MSKYLVWSASNAGEYVRADNVVIEDSLVKFLRKGIVVASYYLPDFLKFNDRNIKPVEET